jgi:hypothetical protein
MEIIVKCLPIKDMNLSKIKGNKLYGMRIHPVYKTKAMHYGIDDPEAAGTPIYAIADGVVIVSKMQGNGKGAGEYIVINHGGWYSYYAHQSKRTAKQGDVIKAGQIIGYVGSTGDSTGPHLHIGICTKFVATSLNSSTWTDPLPLLKACNKSIKEEEKVEIKSLEVEMNGVMTEIPSINYQGREYMQIKGLADADKGDKLEVKYDEKKKLVVITSK